MKEIEDITTASGFMIDLFSPYLKLHIKFTLKDLKNVFVLSEVKSCNAKLCTSLSKWHFLQIIMFSEMSEKALLEATKCHICWRIVIIFYYIEQLVMDKIFPGYFESISYMSEYIFRGFSGLSVAPFHHKYAQNFINIPQMLIKHNLKKTTKITSE